VAVTTVNPTYIATGMFEGAKPMLFTPILTPEDVTDRVWNAMKIGKPRLVMPWTVLFSSFMKGLLPVRAYDWVAKNIFGVYKTMDSFKGH
jgi:short-subunit dehydrogenase